MWWESGGGERKQDPYERVTESGWEAQSLALYNRVFKSPWDLEKAGAIYANDLERCFLPL